MKYFVQTGPGRTLTCSNEKFVVDFALGVGVVRQSWFKESHSLICLRIIKEFEHGGLLLRRYIGSAQQRFLFIQPWIAHFSLYLHRLGTVV